LGTPLSPQLRWFRRESSTADNPDQTDEKKINQTFSIRVIRGETLGFFQKEPVSSYGTA
jgi:hypothetical protein